ncbi:MAG: class I SAM-dependent methyltransferase [Ignavibacteriales bacterium]|nr:class I SAM-dependent methyltransferase [Ignavibacteriales bacterium]
MAVSENMINSNYQAQETNIKKMVPEKEQVLFHIKNQNCAAYRLISEPLEFLTPFFDSSKTWLTVGDYSGLEANYLRQRNQRVVASDLSDAILKEAQSDGLIKEYSKQNVERLTYNDNSFDYVICKEAFHHFPRAYLGLYEMLRVSKSATVLVTEPIDILSKMSFLVLMKNICDKINPLFINRIWKNRFSWESVGNYVFKISEREIEKIAMGMGLPCIAFKRYDHFKSHTTIDGIMDVPINQKLYRKIKLKLAMRSFISSVGIIPHGSLCCVVFKEQPGEKVLLGMKDRGFIIIPLPKNPYLV